MSELFRCKVCTTVMAIDQHEPRIIPECGHTVCLSCLERIIKSTLKCPICDTALKNKDEKSYYPKNFFLYSLMEEAQNHCEHHGGILELICMDCETLLCHQCYLNKAHRNHRVISTDELCEANLKKFNEINKWRNIYYNQKKSDQESINVLLKFLTNRIERDYEERIELLKKKEQEAIQFLENHFEEAKRKFKILEDELETMIINENDMNTQTTNKNINKRIKFYNSDTEEKIRNVKNKLTNENLTKVIEDLSRIEIQLKNYDTDFKLPITILSEPSKKNALELYSKLSNNYYHKDMLRANTFLLKSMSITPAYNINEIEDIIRKIISTFPSDITSEDMLKIYGQMTSQLEPGHTLPDELFAQYLRDSLKDTETIKTRVLEKFMFSEPIKNVKLFGLKKIYGCDNLIYLPKALYCLTNLPNFAIQLIQNHEIITKFYKNSIIYGFMDILNKIWSSIEPDISVNAFENTIKNSLQNHEQRFESFFFEFMNILTRIDDNRLKIMFNKLFDIIYTQHRECMRCKKNTKIEKVTNHLTLQSHSQNSIKPNIFFVHNNQTKQKIEKIDITLPEDINCGEVIEKVAQIYNVEANDLVLMHENKNLFLEFPRDETEISMLSTPNTLQILVCDIHQPKLCLSKENFLVPVFVYSEEDDRFRVGYPRLIVCRLNDKLGDVALKVYERMRPHLNVYFNAENIPSPIDVRNTEEFFEAEYDQLANSDRLPKLGYKLLVLSDSHPTSSAIEQIHKKQHHVTLAEYLAEKSLIYNQFSFKLIFDKDMKADKMNLKSAIPSPEISEGYSIIHSINHFLRKQKRTQEWVCDCSGSNFLVKTEIEELPEILILQFSKNNQIKKIEYPQEISLQHLINSPRYKYSLSVFVGETVFAKNAIDKKWYNFEEKIVQCNLPNDLEPHILFYCQKNTNSM